MRGSIDEIGRVVDAEAIDCGFTNGGTINSARAPPQLARARSAVAEARQFGSSEADLVLLSADEAAARMHARGLLGALYTPHCARIHPARLVRGLAAGPVRTFWKLTFPLILPGIAAAALLSFALSIDGFIITLFNAGSLVTFPLYINGSFRVRFPPQVNVLATLILLVSIVLLVGGSLRSSRRAATAR
jgi:FAD dependent oxidoreductase/Binding-protein-dependent transport system inner membrane component